MHKNWTKLMVNVWRECVVEGTIESIEVTLEK